MPRLGAGQWPLGDALVGDNVAPIEHDREQRAHPLDLVNRPSRQRTVAIVLGKGDEELGLVLPMQEPEIVGEIIARRNGRPAYRHSELALLEIGAVLTAQIIFET